MGAIRRKEKSDNHRLVENDDNLTKAHKNFMRLIIFQLITVPHIDSKEQLDPVIEDIISDLQPNYGILNIFGQN